MPVLVIAEARSAGFSSVENLTSGRSGFHTRSVRASAVAIRVPSGDQAMVRICDDEDVVSGADRWLREL